MKYVLLADRDRPELEPLTSTCSSALLPVLGKPLIEHALEDLYRVGAREVLVVVSSFSHEVKSFVSSGERWGMQLDFELTRGGESPTEVWSRFDPSEVEEALFIRADLVRSPSLVQFLERASEHPGAAEIVGSLQGVAAGLALVRNTAGTSVAVDLDFGRVNRLESIGEYHQANLEAMDGRFDLEPFAAERRPGVWVGLKARVSDDSFEEAPVFVGSQCLVHETAALGPGTVLSSNVLVDRGTSLRSTVVLPGSYIGEGMELEDSIVRGDLLVRVNSGVVTEIGNGAWLASLERNPAAELFRGGFERALGIALLVLCLPFLLLTLLASLASSPARPIQRSWTRGNRRELGDDGLLERRRVAVWEGATRVPLLKHLPRVAAVASGDLRFFGVRPTRTESASAQEAVVHEWNCVKGSVPRGLLSPGLAAICAGGSRTEAELADVLYTSGAEGFGTAYWLVRLSRVLFSSAAWRTKGRDRTTGKVLHAANRWRQTGAEEDIQVERA
jgi:hypothetical protein